jgi:hypothetical protein
MQFAGGRLLDNWQGRGIIFKKERTKFVTPNFDRIRLQQERKEMARQTSTVHNMAERDRLTRFWSFYGFLSKDPLSPFSHMIDVFFTIDGKISCNILQFNLPISLWVLSWCC